MAARWRDTWRTRLRAWCARRASWRPRPRTTSAVRALRGRRLGSAPNGDGAPEMDGRTSPDTSRATGAALADEGAKGVMMVDSPPHQPQKTNIYTCVYIHIACAKKKRHFEMTFCCAEKGVQIMAQTWRNSFVRGKLHLDSATTPTRLGHDSARRPCKKSRFCRV